MAEERSVMVTTANLTKERLNAALADKEKAKRAKRQTLADRKREQYLPRSIEHTIRKLEALLQEAARRGVPITEDQQERCHLLRSRYLTDPNMVNEVWEQITQPEGENNDDQD